ncbi:adaptor complex AP-3 small subunit, putative [Leishmania panamensis]|uniref:AP complex subunit sigma n=3 Tax=Leishmania guyanensis species complex TaxID=38579 RepID=A0A088RS43_LEIPA|nr:adaptor complex AP-3 small subunit, putative [Leishmania panamensis]AIN98783.1 adaptor complex AP-3 small subunit, putative [Leishmania panamensis]CCM19041.1 adaptor complex AP-3 small subunit, putative [Leishmania guyanensis]
MIKAVLIINTAGKIRLLSFYEKTISLTQQQELVRSIHRAISRRGDELCNFVDNFKEWPTPDTRIIYRRYATLCFVFVTDSSESQLAILDLIQVFVESLDRTFENVCELDLIFHSEKVQYVLMEMIMGGLVLEMSRDEIIRSLGEMSRLSAKMTAENTTSRTLSGYH